MVRNFISLQRMQVISWCYLAVLTAGSWLAFSWNFAWSVLAGGLISIASFWVSQRDLMRFLDTLANSSAEGRIVKGAEPGKGAVILKFWLRIAIIGVVLLLLIKSGYVNIFGLILGLSTVVFTVTFTAVDVVRHYYFSGRR